MFFKLSLISTVQDGPILPEPQGTSLFSAIYRGGLYHGDARPKSSPQTYGAVHDVDACAPVPGSAFPFKGNIQMSSIRESTPRKINMEPKNHPIEKENHLPIHHFQVPC